MTSTYLCCVERDPPSLIKFHHLLSASQHLITDGFQTRSGRKSPSAHRWQQWCESKIISWGDDGHIILRNVEPSQEVHPTPSSPKKDNLLSLMRRQSWFTAKPELYVLDFLCDPIQTIWPSWIVGCFCFTGDGGLRSG